MAIINNDESFFEFTFRSEVLSSQEDTVCLCLFFSEDIFDELIFNTRLTDFTKDFNYTSDIENGVINKLVIILPATTKCQTYSQKPFFEDKKIDKSRFSFLIKTGDPIFLLYDENAVWHNGNEHSFETDKLDSIVKEIKLKGLYQIFEYGDGILESGSSHHYILQNEFHADKFIRTANILRKSSFIDFIAVFLLGFIEAGDKKVYIDTSGIASLIYSINKLKNVFNQNIHLAISSFNSYSGINSLINDDYTKIIISASTSGGLSNKLITKGFSSERINILFYLNEETPSVKGSL